MNQAHHPAKGVHATHVLENRNHCHCGRQAFRKKASSWICPRCLAIEERMYGNGGERLWTGATMPMKK